MSEIARRPYVATKPARFTPDFVIQGPQTPFFLAAGRGLYAGRGSADTVNRIASGAYELGIGDINADPRAAMAKNIAQMTEAFELPRTFKPEQVFDARYPLPRHERMSTR